MITYGKVEEFKNTRVRISNEGNMIWVELGTTKVREHFPYAEGAEVILVGKLIKTPMGAKMIQAIAGRPCEHVAEARRAGTGPEH